MCFTTSTEVKAQVAVGDKAPELSFLRPLTLNENGWPLSYNEQVTVIDFWATWCAPCIAAFPHVNDLIDQFEGKVSFLAITTESEEKVNAFFERGKILKGIKMLDNDSFAHEAFGIETIPMAFVVDINGIIVWKGSSSKLTKEVLEAAISNAGIEEEDKRPAAITRQQEQEEAFYEGALFSFIAAVADTTSQRNYPTGGWRYEEDYVLKIRKNDDLVEGIGWFLNVNPKTRMMVLDPKGVSNGVKVDYFYKCGTAAFNEYTNKYFVNNKEGNHFLSLMGGVFQFEPRIEKKDVPVLVISLENAELFKQAVSIQDDRSGYNDSDPANIEMINMPVAVLAQMLERNLEIPVEVQPTLLAGGLYDLTINATTIASARASLSQYGLKLMEEKKEIDFLVLDFSENGGKDD
jgi:thiol-disulfide isomerase/thioredoxin